MTAAFGATQGPPKIAFERRELNRVLFFYGRMVAAGEWRDYAIDCLKDVALFSIYRRSSESPIYVVEKRPSRPQGAYAVLDAGGFILKRGPDLDQVLKVFDRKLMRVIERR